jgi:hypothetical protein
MTMLLYATLVAPVLALPGMLLMDRLERWALAAGTRPTQLVPRRSASPKAAERSDPGATAA